jgi:ankyrin repeat protein
LFNAAVRGPADAVRLLLESGANAAAPSGFGGYTPLMGAAYSETGSVESIKLLLKAGADVNSRAPTGDTALQLARRRGNTEIVDLLVKAGAKE